MPAKRWMGAVGTSLGNASIGRAGDFLDIQGNGSVHLEGRLSVEGPACCLQDFLRGQWSRGDVDGIPVEVMAGDIDVLSIRYVVNSCQEQCDPDAGPVDSCGRVLNGFRQDLGIGAHTFSFQPPSDHCPR